MTTLQSAPQTAVSAAASVGDKRLPPATIALTQGSQYKPPLCKGRGTTEGGGRVAKIKGCKIKGCKEGILQKPSPTNAS